MPANAVTHLGPSGGQARFLSLIRNSMQEACLVVFWHFCLQTQMETKHERTSYSNSSDTPKFWVMFGTKIVGWKQAERRRIGTNNFSLFPSRLVLWRDVCFLYLIFPLRCTPGMSQNLVLLLSVAVSADSLIPGVIWQISTHTPNFTGSSSLTLGILLDRRCKNVGIRNKSRVFCNKLISQSGILSMQLFGIVGEN